MLFTKIIPISTYDEEIPLQVVFYKGPVQEYI